MRRTWLPCNGSADPDKVRAQIREIRQLTNKPFAVNIVIMNPNAEDIAKLVCEEKVEIVMTGAGSPAKYIDTFKRTLKNYFGYP
jgi:enoyl-[acyl-carrier protein] reductase II